MSVPRPEYPRPQFVRSEWMCLNGEWQFEIDGADSGLARGLKERELADKITVPFCPESKLSGLAHVDFMAAVWYRRTVVIPESWAGNRVLLHFQAVDYDATVWVNGEEIGRHRGGFSPICCDVTRVAQPGEEITIVVRARDDHRPPQARGKQSQKYAAHGCMYTRTTGIWQTVWMEPVPEYSLKRTRITPDVANGAIRLEQPITNNRLGLKLRATLSDENGIVVQNSVRADLDFAPRLDLAIPEERRREWSPSDPHLYDLLIELVDSGGNIVDSVKSYAGLRCISIDGKKVKINGKTIFQRLILDQGYYPDGVLTAPTDADLIKDITLSMDAGFNGARLHQKVFEERFLYHADRLGYLVWGEFADWGCANYGTHQDHQHPNSSYTTQWLEVLQRDYSHPSIIGWCPLNETWQEITDVITDLDDVTHGMYLATKAMDTTRPVLDTSGYAHRVWETDIYDSHDYIHEANFEEGFERFKEGHSHMAEDKPFVNGGWVGGPNTMSVQYRGQPYFCSEFGGFKWNPNYEADQKNTSEKDQNQSWGYGSDPTTFEDLHERFALKCDLFLDNPYMFGYCYTQMTDIQPEENGIYTFDRRPKFDIERIRKIQQRAAAIELE